MSIWGKLARAALAVPFGSVTAPLESHSTSARGQVKITAIKAMQPKQGATLIKIETDAGISGYGPCGESGPFARDRHRRAGAWPAPAPGPDRQGPAGHPGALPQHVLRLSPARAPDPRAAAASTSPSGTWPARSWASPSPSCWAATSATRSRSTRTAGGGDFFSKEAWRDRAQELTEDPHGFKAFKVDIHHALGVPHAAVHPEHRPAGGAQGPPRPTPWPARRSATTSTSSSTATASWTCPAPSGWPRRSSRSSRSSSRTRWRPQFSESWLALRRATRLPLLTGENLELADAGAALPPEPGGGLPPARPRSTAGGITGAKMIADLAGALPHPDLPAQRQRPGALNMASQQFSAAIFNCPMMECRRDADQAPEAASNVPVIKDGRDEGLHAARPGPGPRPGLPQGQPGRGRALVGLRLSDRSRYCTGEE